MNTQVPAGAEPSTSDLTQPILPADRAFVVQFVAASARGDGGLGRIEHVVSGRSARFATTERMFEFMAEVLAAIDAGPAAVGETQSASNARFTLR